MSKVANIFRYLILPADITAIGLAIISAYFLKTEIYSRQAGNISQVLILPLSDYIKLYLFSLPIFLTAFSLADLYNLKIKRPLLDEFARIFVANLFSFTFLLAILFSLKVYEVSRFIVIYSFAISTTLVFLLRSLLRGIELWLIQEGSLKRRVCFWNNNDYGKELAEAIKKTRFSFFKYFGELEEFSKGGDFLSKAKELIRKSLFEELWIFHPEEKREYLAEILAECQVYGVKVRLLPLGNEFFWGKVETEEVFGFPSLVIKRTPLEGWNRILKRLMDLIISFLLLILLSPLFLIISLIIKIFDPGPVIFKQKRLGEKGEFTFYKFRTMKVDAEKEHQKYIEQYGNMFKLKNDPRVTPLGRFLRKYSLDELPQLYNVFKGDMSLVGPRPPMPIEVERYTAQEKRRLGIKPGITGLWQISGRSDLSFNKWVMLDAYYIENWSLWLDIKILLKTIFVLLKGKGAY